jgi:hypothetical protein
LANGVGNEARRDGCAVVVQHANQPRRIGTSSSLTSMECIVRIAVLLHYKHLVVLNYETAYRLGEREGLQPQRIQVHAVPASSTSSASRMAGLVEPK